MNTTMLIKDKDIYFILDGDWPRSIRFPGPSKEDCNFITSRGDWAPMICLPKRGLTHRINEELIRHGEKHGIRVEGKALSILGTKFLVIRTDFASRQWDVVLKGYKGYLIFAICKVEDWLEFLNYRIMRIAFNFGPTKRFVDWPEGCYGQWRTPKTLSLKKVLRGYKRFLTRQV